MNSKQHTDIINGCVRMYMRLFCDQGSEHTDFYKDVNDKNFKFKISYNGVLVLEIESIDNYTKIAVINYEYNGYGDCIHIQSENAKKAASGDLNEAGYTILDIGPDLFGMEFLIKNFMTSRKRRGYREYANQCATRFEDQSNEECEH